MRPGGNQRKTRMMTAMMKKPSAMPMSGARTMNSIVLVQPDGMIAAMPAFASAAPA